MVGVECIDRHAADWVDRTLSFGSHNHGLGNEHALGSQLDELGKDGNCDLLVGRATKIEPGWDSQTVKFGGIHTTRTQVLADSIGPSV
jgi:hypothetical protein